ncbi:MAG: hypothetical protein FJW63_10065 [Actinobacteria bacterium]|nr:hypothetical protein [Actinomycetota bacterium]
MCFAIINNPTVANFLEDFIGFNYKSTCENIDYNSLNGNISQYEGCKVKFKGKINYTEPLNDGNLIVMNIDGSEKKRICIFYDGQPILMSNNMITVYGVVYSKREVSQFGKYIPLIFARYIDFQS